ncbi:MAG: FmdB family zinc ribbon protein [Planctomycetia bacterium]|jgi:putative FmdB family regulatory protein
MPTYDYHCTKCGHELEIFHSMKDAPKKKCPKCGKNGLEKKIGAGAGFLFKGEGFYLTDYRSEGYKSDAKKDKEATTATPSEPAKASEPKPAEAKPASAKTPAKSEAKPKSKS